MTQKPIHIVHLLSWQPTADEPTKGNFCVRHIQSIASLCPSVLLTVDLETHLSKKTIVKTEGIYIHVEVKIKAFRSFFRYLNKTINRYRIFKAYNWGLAYIRKNIFNPDLVHLHVALPAGKIALYWKFRYQLPYLLTEHWSIYNPEDTRLNKNKIKKDILSIAQHASAITAVSALLKENMENFGIKQTIYVIPNVVDVDLFKLQEKKITTKKHLLHVSSLNDEEKNFSGILRGIKRLREVRNDFVLNVVHDYPPTEYIAFIEKNNLNEVIVFHGKKTMEELADYYANSDFLVMFSNFETFSCVVMEALACGIPVLATHTGAIPEMLNNERGIVIEPKDEDALYEKMNFLCDTSHQYSPTTIRDYVIRHFSANIIGERFLELYRQCQKE